MSRLPLVQALVAHLGLEGVAELEAQAVRHRRVPARLAARLAKPDRLRLTARQREIMVLLVTGASRQEIADELGVSYETVKAHLRSAYRRLGVHDRVDAINAFLDEAA